MGFRFVTILVYVLCFFLTAWIYMYLLRKRRTIITRMSTRASLIRVEEKEKIDVLRNDVQPKTRGKSVCKQPLNRTHERKVIAVEFITVAKYPRPVITAKIRNEANLPISN